MFKTIHYKYIPTKNERIKYLCLINNIKYTEINESYTSICSFYNNEEIKYHNIYKNKRITRSLFKTGSGKIINGRIKYSGKK